MPNGGPPGAPHQPKPNQYPGVPVPTSSQLPSGGPGLKEGSKPPSGPGTTGVKGSSTPGAQPQSAGGPGPKEGSKPPSGPGTTGVKGTSTPAAPAQPAGEPGSKRTAPQIKQCYQPGTGPFGSETLVNQAYLNIIQEYAGPESIQASVHPTLNLFDRLENIKAKGTKEELGDARAKQENLQRVSQQHPEGPAVVDMVTTQQSHSILYSEAGEWKLAWDPSHKHPSQKTGNKASEYILKKGIQFGLKKTVSNGAQAIGPALDAAKALQQSQHEQLLNRPKSDQAAQMQIDGIHTRRVVAALAEQAVTSAGISSANVPRLEQHIWTTYRDYKEASMDYAGVLERNAQLGGARSHPTLRQGP